MTFKFKDRYSDRNVEINFALVKEIRESEDVENDLYCQLSTRHPNYRYIEGSINDMVKMIYDIGCDNGVIVGRAQMKAEMERKAQMKLSYEKPKVIDKPTVDIETVPDEDEPELKGYILSEYKGYVCSAQIVSFKDIPDYVDGIVKAKTMAFTSDGETYVFDMTIDEFKKVLAKKQEELR